MGSDFFRSAVEGPLSLFGRNSSVGKIVQNDPLMNAIGVEQKTPPSAAPQGGYYAGKEPTLAAAAAGYQPPTGYSAPATGVTQSQPAPVGGIMPNTARPRLGNAFQG